LINVIALFDLHAGKRESFLEEFRKIIPLVHAEEGCIEYEPTVDVDTGFEGVDPPRPDRVTIVEKWDSVAAFKAHIAAPHSGEFLRVAEPWIDHFQLFVTEAARQTISC